MVDGSKKVRKWREEVSEKEGTVAKEKKGWLGKKKRTL